MKISNKVWFLFIKKINAAAVALALTVSMFPAGLSGINFAFADTTATLYPNGQGSYTAWDNGVATVDETGTPSCSDTESIHETTTNDRESVTISLASIANGATITSVDVTVYDRGDSVSGGTYKTFA